MDYYLITIIISIMLFISLVIIGVSFATEDEDVVGKILESKGIARNPPEVNETEEIGDMPGQISSFTEGPIVVVPP